MLGLVSDAGNAGPGMRAVGGGGDRAERAPGHEPGRARARLALIEQQVTLAGAVREREVLLSEQPDPAGSESWRARERGRLERVISEAEGRAAELLPLVGDPEAVADEQGRLPAERREQYLAEFTAQLDDEASGLRERLPALRTELTTAKGSQGRAAIREQLRQGTARLSYLQAVSPFTAPDMCSECPWPLGWHDTAVTFCLDTGAVLSHPCHAWPVWNAQLAVGFARALEAIKRMKDPPPTPEPAPQPLAVIASGTPVQDIIAQLTEVQTAHPEAQARRGKRNSWEIWAAPPPDQPASGG